MNEPTVLIFTPMDLEFRAVVRHLEGERETIFEDDMAYEKGHFKGKHRQYTVVVCETGMKNVTTALAVERAIQRFKPDICFLIGVAGGLKDVKVGDVIVATSAYEAESGKEVANDQFLPRTSEYVFSRKLRAFAQAISRTDTWKNRTTDKAPKANIVLGPIAGGEKVIAAAETIGFKRLQQFLSHVKAIEMEAVGFGSAIQPYSNLHAITIRGISDMCEGKNEADDRDWQPVVADRAAAVGFELLGESDMSSIIQNHIDMDVKTLAKEIFALLFPLPESFKEIGSDFANAANNDVRAIWKKVKPLFIDEIKELEKDPEDSDAQAAVRAKLKRVVEADAGLKGELEGLLEKIKTTGVGSQLQNSIVGNNNKNIVQGATIIVKEGGFRVGDG